MRSSCIALVLATLTIGHVVASPFKHLQHAHFHTKKVAELNVEAEMEKREPTENVVNIPAMDVEIIPRSTSSLSTTDSSKLAALGCKTGINAVSSSGGVWIGSGGAYTNTFTNGAGQALILVIWGPSASWVNVDSPLITYSLASGASVTISFNSGSIGAWSAIYSDTKLVNGQVSNTWGEYTFSSSGVFDISREPNMSGHSMTVVGPKCTSNMSTCVFVCASGNVCTTGYELLNCAAGSQSGAQSATVNGAASGGCGGLGSSAAIKTTFS